MTALGGPDRRFIAFLAVRVTFFVMFSTFFRALSARFPARRASSTGGTPEVDLAWFAPLAASVLAERRRDAADAIVEIAPFLNVFHRDVVVTLDSERGSLLLGFPCGTSWRFAVEDVNAASQIAAGARLGGLLVRLSASGDGLVRIHGVWERLSYVLWGLPVRDALSA